MKERQRQMEKRYATTNISSDKLTEGLTQRRKVEVKQAAKPQKAGMNIVTGWDRNMEGIGGSHPVTSTGA